MRTYIGPLLLAASLLAGCGADTTGACASNDDCHGIGVCDLASHRCVGCNSTEDCGAGEICENKVCVPGCDELHGCPDGMQCDLAKHSCVGCVDDSGCGGATPQCDPAKHSCVGCVNDSGCGGTTPRCDTARHSCIGCLDDGDCGAGGACCNGACVDAKNDPANCGACGNSCGAGGACCAGACASLTTQTNCGACGNTCTGGDFCDSHGTCQHPTYPNFCKNMKVYEIYDGIGGDNAAADTMASTVLTNCAPGTQLLKGNQTDPALVDQTTGEPLGGAGVTYVLGGGPFPNKVLKWLEKTHDITRIYFDAPDGVNYNWVRRSDTKTVASMLASKCNPSAYDQFIVELVTDPNNGTLSLIGYGACSGAAGTRAAAYYFANVMLANPANFPDSWYVFEWSEASGDGQPGPGDTFNVLAHGM